jgi:hypothetical protein
MSDEIVKVPEVEPEFKTTLTPEQLAAAEAEVKSRPFSARNPELGRMIKCQVCGLRHRSVQKCEQKFTNRAGDFEYFHEEEIDGEVKLVPTLRTAIPHDEKPTMKQIVGAAATNKKRFHPHHSKIKLLFIERTRKVFDELGFELVDGKSEEFKALTPDEQKAVAEKFQKDLQRARVVAARQIRKEREFSDRKYRRMRDTSRRTNKGLL